MNFIKRNLIWILGGGAALYFLGKKLTAMAPEDPRYAKVQSLLNALMVPGTKITELQLGLTGPVSLLYTAPQGPGNFMTAPRATWPSIDHMISELQSMVQKGALIGNSTYRLPNQDGSFFGGSAMGDYIKG